MIRVGIVGENYYNDSIALRNLLEKQYDINKVQFVPMLKGTTGDKLKSKGIKRLLEEEIKKKSKKGKINFIIFFHDLDGFPSEEEKIKDIQNWFEAVKLYELDTLFITIFESEALLLADIKTINKFYKVTINFSQSPLWQEKPKEFLYRKTAEKYKQSDCPELFALLHFDSVYQKHKGEHSFQSFILELDEKLNHA
ncbi:MAG: hypothetical protein SFU99_02865 [Saprospiraceae bacterium]|nr:hypothetical protein [Saprospiraceae bacterium]